MGELQFAPTFAHINPLKTIKGELQFAPTIVHINLL